MFPFGLMLSLLVKCKYYLYLILEMKGFKGWKVLNVGGSLDYHSILFFLIFIIFGSPNPNRSFPPTFLFSSGTMDSAREFCGQCYTMSHPYTLHAQMVVEEAKNQTIAFFNPHPVPEVEMT